MVTPRHSRDAWIAQASCECEAEVAAMVLAHSMSVYTMLHSCRSYSCRLNVIRLVNHDEAELREC